MVDPNTVRKSLDDARREAEQLGFVLLAMELEMGQAQAEDRLRTQGSRPPPAAVARTPRRFAWRRSAGPSNPPPGEPALIAVSLWTMPAV